MTPRMVARGGDRFFGGTNDITLWAFHGYHITEILLESSEQIPSCLPRRIYTQVSKLGERRQASSDIVGFGNDLDNVIVCGYGDVVLGRFF